MADEVRMPNQGREPYAERPENPKVFPVGDHIPNQGQVQPRSDADIKSDCETALFYDTAVSSLDVKCQVQGGTVTLTGTVDSELKKRLAAEDAWKVPGVKDVKNQIQVNEAQIPSRAAGQDMTQAKPPTNIMGEPVQGNQPQQAQQGQQLRQGQQPSKPSDFGMGR